MWHGRILEELQKFILKKAFFLKRLFHKVFDKVYVKIARGKFEKEKVTFLTTRFLLLLLIKIKLLIYATSICKWAVSFTSKDHYFNVKAFQIIQICNIPGLGKFIFLTKNMSALQKWKYQKWQNSMFNGTFIVKKIFV